MKRIFLLFSFLLLPLGVWAETRVAATVDSDLIGVDDELVFTITVTDGSDVEDPQLPALPGFTVVASGTTSNFQFINGQMSSSKSFVYTLIPQAEGRYTLGPVAVRVGGKEYKTNPVNVTVQKIAAPPSRPRVLQPFDEDEGEEPAPLPPADAEKPYWITATVSNTSPYINEQVIYTFRFYRSVNVGGASLEMPDFTRFAVEDLTPEKKSYQEIDGVRYLVSEKSVALFALEPGPTMIEETRLKVEVPDARGRSLFDDPFFGFGHMRLKAKVLKAPAIKLDVKPLPAEVPDDFTNLVGTYALAVTLSGQEVKKGESVTLTAEINGRGNIKDAALPKAAPLDGIKIYDDKPTVDLVRKETGVDGKKVFKRALVPEKEGMVSIPPLHFSYFDPQKGTFERLEGPAFTLKVLPGDSQNLNVVTAPQDVPPATSPQKPVVEDIATLHAIPDLSGPKSWPAVVIKILLWVPPLLYFLTRLVLFLKRRQENGGGVKVGRALKRCLSKNREALKREDVSQAAIGILEAVRDYLAAKSGRQGGGLTLPEMLEILRSFDLDDHLVDLFKKRIVELEAVSFGGMGGRPENLAQISQDLIQFLRKVDKK